MYVGGAGVVEALHRLERRGFVELRRDYVPYLERSLEARPDFPDDDPERSLWMGETGIRLVLQRLAPSQANLERLAELIAANEQDEHCELMWGSPGTILAGRELGLDVTPSSEWLQGRRDADGLWTQRLHGDSSRCLGPAHGFAGCVLALGEGRGVSETLQRLRRRGGRARQLAAGRRDDAARRTPRRPDPHAVVPRRAGDRRDARHLLDEELAVAGGELTWRAGPLRKGASLCHGTAGTATRSSRCSSARETNGGSHERARSRCTLPPRWSAAGRTTGAAATRSGRATSARRSTSPTASTVEGSYPPVAGTDADEF